MADCLLGMDYGTGGAKACIIMVLTEGGAVSRLWRTIITDVFDVTLALTRRRTGAPGAPVLAGICGN